MFAVVSINEMSGGDKFVYFRLNPALSSLDSYQAVLMSHMTVISVHILNKKQITKKRDLFHYNLKLSRLFHNLR